MITGNRGEWSEIYALFKLLGDGQVFVGDADLNKIENLFYPIIKILRTEDCADYDYEVAGDIILVSGNGGEITRIPVADFHRQATALFIAIKNATGASFSIPEAEEFMNSVKCHTLKSQSNDKTDIRIVIHDPRTETEPLLGFSIKSQLGSPSTLLNASKKHTNIIFRITNTTISSADAIRINAISSRRKIKDRIKEIKRLNAHLLLFDFESSIFKNNLVLIDGCLPSIIAEIVERYYSGTEKRLKYIVSKLEEDNPLRFDIQHGHRFYEHKVKRFLTDAALGMMPATVWSGIYEATGGYLIVKEDGELLCYHIYNKNELENYLYANTKLETPSSSRHDFGEIEMNPDGQFIKLNLQIRFTF